MKQVKCAFVALVALCALADSAFALRDICSGKEKAVSNAEKSIVKLQTRLEKDIQKLDGGIAKCSEKLIKNEERRKNKIDQIEFREAECVRTAANRVAKCGIDFLLKDADCAANAAKRLADMKLLCDERADNQAETTNSIAANKAQSITRTCAAQEAQNRSKIARNESNISLAVSKKDAALQELSQCRATQPPAA